MNQRHHGVHPRSSAKTYQRTQAPGGREPHRQSAAVAASAHADDDQAFIDVVSLEDE